MALLAAIKIVLLVLVSNLKEDQSAVALVVHCQERNETNNHRNKTEIGIQESFFPVTHSLNNMLYLADHRREKNLEEYTESIL